MIPSLAILDGNVGSMPALKLTLCAVLPFTNRAPGAASKVRLGTWRGWGPGCAGPHMVPQGVLGPFQA